MNVDNAISSKITYISGFLEQLPEDSFISEPEIRKRVLIDSCKLAQDYIKNGAYDNAEKTLVHDIRSRMDHRGDDWVVDFMAQQELMIMIDSVVGYLHAME